MHLLILLFSTTDQNNLLVFIGEHVFGFDNKIENEKFSVLPDSSTNMISVWHKECIKRIFPHDLYMSTCVSTRSKDWLVNYVTLLK